MAPSLRRVAALEALRLRLLAGGGALDRPVRWVAVSELEDPTPFLEGDELVLTTGMRLTSDDAKLYVSRLVTRGAAGLGFGVGLTHEEVPAGFVRAAEEAGLPLVEVPRATPFIAVGKAVSDLLAAERYEEIRGAFAAQGRLTRAALQPEGMDAVVDRLAREIGGWVLLLDEAGNIRHAAGEPGGKKDGAAELAAKRAAALAPEVARLRAAGAPSSLALAAPDEHVVVQPLGRRGSFAVGSARPFSAIGHTIINAAASLLTLGLEQGSGPKEGGRRVRAAVLRLLLAGEVQGATETVAELGAELPSGPLIVLACDTPDPDALVACLPCFTAPYGEITIALAPAAEAEDLIALAAARGRVGASNPASDPKDLSTAIDQAEQALVTANPVARFAELAGQGLLSLVDPEAARAFAAALLAPLHAYGSRADLVSSLHAYLASNGHWDAAAQRLGVHRHTLRYRMRRVGELLGRDLDDPATRAELWIALTFNPGG
ncbi:PucR family transcriptional regulator [Acrocarpospora macrocephala]|uniref:PucR family transcriptional regulator n=1 Tax=Acrocarpospora macrocephala TaxID=150177 RepID=A0A5M3WQH9_9ACTN|nr:PucR family transcriptional regulator [Acrocarpospora macrocephala]GES11617.1 PucR family transcriptional regulator [Acrocarpospora macrocephala]